MGRHTNPWALDAIERIARLGDELGYVTPGDETRIHKGWSDVTWEMPSEGDHRWFLLAGEVESSKSNWKQVRNNAAKNVSLRPLVFVHLFAPNVRLSEEDRSQLTALFPNTRVIIADGEHGLEAVLKALSELKPAAFQREIEKRRSRNRNIHSLFAAPSPRVVDVVADRQYRGPYHLPGTSTTLEFITLTLDVLSSDVMSGALAGTRTTAVDYLSREGVRDLVDGDSHIVSYASSKINPCTELLLDRVESSSGQCIRFVMEADLRAGVHHSRLPNKVPDARAALFVNGEELYHSNSLDHGVIVRSRFDDDSERMYWIFAGCGRPGSIAARKLVFDNCWDGALWTSLAPSLRSKSFAVIFSVQCDRPNSDQLGTLERLQVIPLVRR